MTHHDPENPTGDKESAWGWAGGGPPGPQSVNAGTKWVFRLPVTGTGDAPVCQWSSPFLKDGAYTVSDDTLTLSVDIPEQETGIHKIHFKLSRGSNLEGFVFLKILRPGGSENAAVQDADTFKTDAAAGTASLPPILQKKNQKNKAQPHTADDVSADLEPKTPRLPPGRYFILVYRDNILIPELRTELHPHKSLAAGKFSHSKNIRPDLDFKPHFKSKDAARSCSREQAKIYWQNHRIILKNVGKADLKLPKDLDLETGGRHCWQPGEMIGIPGGLTLTLEKEE